MRKIIIYAKSNPEQTLKEHTDDLIKNYNVLKDSYGYKLKDPIIWKLLLIAVKYHDTGKAYCKFQYDIRKNMNMKVSSPTLKYDIPHNYLSPAFLPYMDLKMNIDEIKVLVEAIAYHHERDTEPDKDIINEIVDKDLKYKIDDIKRELNIPVPNKLNTIYTAWIKPRNRITSKNKDYFLYIMVKGLLNRIDHSASAGEKIERDSDKNVADYTNKYFKLNDMKLRSVQEFAASNKDKNIIITASTGMGKTEAALFWIDKDKAFFTLPLRVSINALYDRITKKINFKSTGLLHSTNMEYLEDQKYDNAEEIYDQSRILSSKLTFTTIDQIFKFPFKYKGYEKIYATLAYSKVVIDEIQAYSPEIVAIILKGLEMIHNIGGKFMIMTATLPPFYIDYLKDRKIIDENDSIIGKFLGKKIRHKIKVNEKPILDDINKILEKGETNKVIVIVNTVDRAIKLYDEIPKYKTDNVHLLHSMFIQKHREILEEKIKAFSDDKIDKGIWITTQIVEASLDVDFDYLFTELSPLDSLFQRLGRCYRQRQFDINEPNVYIYTEDVKGIGYIYDKDIWNESKKMILQYDNALLTERDKYNMVQKLYSTKNLKENCKKFFEKFQNAMTLLDTLNDRNITSSAAQRILRNIQSITVIPRNLFENKNLLLLIDKYKKSDDKNERRKLRRNIKKYTVDVQKYRIKNSSNISQCNIKGLDDIYILNKKYDFDEDKFTGRGICMDQDLDNII